MKKPVYSKPAWIKAGSHGWVKVSETDFLDVSSDEFGRDVYKFNFKGETFESIVVRGSQPG